MPYTFAHIGFIAPVKKKWQTNFSTTGLVFGSIAPDYDILFRLTNVRMHLFQYDIVCILFMIFPLALVSALFFHLFCSAVLFNNLPAFYQNKFKEYKAFDFIETFKKDYLSISLSILFAIILHLILDFFCHCLNAYQTRLTILQLFHNQLLGDVSYFFAIYGLPVLFSLAGFIILFPYIFKEKDILKHLKFSRQQLLFWLWILVNTFLFTLLKFYTSAIDYEFIIDFIAISVTSSFILAIYTTCLIYFLSQKFRRDV